MLSTFKPSMPYETGKLISLSKCPVFSTNASIVARRAEVRIYNMCPDREPR